MPFRALRVSRRILLVLVLSALLGTSSVSAQDRPASPSGGAEKSSARPLGPDRQALAAIVRPTRWTPEEVDRYISDILDVSSRTHHVFEDDPQIRMLSEVGPENITSLFRALGKSGGVADAHLERAIPLVIQDAHRDLLLQYLPQHPRLAAIVVARGWVRDAQDILMEGLKRGQPLGAAWLQAVVELDDPLAPDALRRYLVSSGDSISAYGALKAIGYRDLDGAVREAWRAMTVTRRSSLDHFAPIAARHGVVEALVLMARTVESRRDTLTSRELERALVELVPYEGNPQQLAEFVIENSHRLSFDARTQRYLDR